MNLLSYPSLVEAPFISVRIGDYTFGAYTSTSKKPNYISPVRVTYPNFMKSLSVVKTNGIVNVYTINMVYQIRQGDDPNLLEKVFGSASRTRDIYITYGDCASPSFVYKEEKALITKVSSSVNFNGSNISYTINCTSTAMGAQAGTHSFPAYTGKPSDVIKRLLSSEQYGLLDIFYGMRDNALVQRYGLLLANDKSVKIEQKNNINILDYLNYLVGCMSDVNDPQDSALKKSRYYLNIVDDIRNAFRGPYFKITEVKSDANYSSVPNLFEVDVNVPEKNFVTEFRITSDDSWSILYDYSQKLQQPSYVYRLNGDGKMTTEYSPTITKSGEFLRTTEAEKTWWTNMTQFPISATLTIKGLLRPAILMSYVKVNSYFYGQRHISSGLYIITKQVDSVGANGYKTTLSLTRIGGDTDDYTSRS